MLPISIRNPENGPEEVDYLPDPILLDVKHTEAVRLMLEKRKHLVVMIDELSPPYGREIPNLTPARQCRSLSEVTVF